MRKFLIAVLRILARATIRKYKPEVIAITGTAGKTSAKEVIYTVLKHRYRTRKSHANFNTEIGVPLTILGDYKKTGGPIFWLAVILRGAGMVVTPKFLQGKPYPELLVLEYAADRPGDITYLTNVARPRISVVTLVGEFPVHVEFYNNAEEVAKEKEVLVRALSKQGVAILNADDARVKAMREATRGNVQTYGFDEDATVVISEYEVQTRDDNGLTVPEGIRFVLESGGEKIPVTIAGVIGKAQAYATAAAALVGLNKGMKLYDVAKALAYYQAPKQRVTIVRGKEKSIILDDSYNSSPAAAINALEALKDIGAKRTICVLGDMRELGVLTERAHASVGVTAKKTCDVLATIGPSASIIADSAEREGMKKDKIFCYQNVDEAIEPLQNILQEGDGVLVKASLAVGAEKVVKALRA